MVHKPTVEQQDVYDAIQYTDDNLLINALAGSGKTTTIVNACKYIPEDKKTTFLAFNKHIKNELSEKLPAHIRSSTTHGVGLSAIKRKYGDTIKLDEFKVQNALKKLLKSRSEIWRLEDVYELEIDLTVYKRDLKKMVDLCRSTLTFKDKYIGFLYEKYNFNNRYNQELFIKRTKKILEIVSEDTKTFDFTDMIYIPATNNKIFLFPQDYVIVDEVQDINRAQQEMIRKMLKKDKAGEIIGRLISVGDQHQNIYGFTGTGDRSFDWFVNFPNTKVFPLTTTFRCSKSVVAHANKLVPNLKPLDNAPEGQVRLDGDVFSEPVDGDFILCRKTAPLMKIFLHLIINGKRATIKGSDIGRNLIEMVGNKATISDVIRDTQNKINDAQFLLLQRGILNPEDDMGFVTLSDQASTLIFLSKICKTVDQLKNRIGKIFKDDVEGIVLSTIHKSKGLEADRVFIIRPDLIPLKTPKAWEAQQEKNLEYVAITRAKKELIYDYEYNDEEISLEDIQKQTYM